MLIYFKIMYYNAKLLINHINCYWLPDVMIFIDMMDILMWSQYLVAIPGGYGITWLAMLNN